MWMVHACRHCIFSCPIQRGVVFYLHGKSTGRIESEAQLKSQVRRDGTPLHRVMRANTR